MNKNVKNMMYGRKGVIKRCTMMKSSTGIIDINYLARLFPNVGSQSKSKFKSSRFLGGFFLYYKCGRWPEFIVQAENRQHNVMDRLLIRSEAFLAGQAPPTDNNRLSVLRKSVGDSILVQDAIDTKAIVHAEIFEFMENWLKIKRNKGSNVEKSLYASMSTFELVDRLLAKRPLTFMGAHDRHMLRDGKVSVVSRRFLDIGTEKEEYPLVLEDYISYDEILLAALVGVGTPTPFINTGSRTNIARKAKVGSYICHGVYYGLVGPRYEKRGLMEWRYTIERGESHHDMNRPGSDEIDEAWKNLYSKGIWDLGLCAAAGGTAKLNRAMYRKRIAWSLVPFLHDVDRRAKAEGKKALAFVVGLGLGVWQVSREQPMLFVEELVDILTKTKFDNVAIVDCSWFPADCASNGGEYNGVALRFSKHDPAQIMEKQEENELLRCPCFAWDGNSAPGNEYWIGSLAGSGDPAAACCSAVAELGNACINESLKGSEIRVYE